MLDNYQRAVAETRAPHARLVRSVFALDRNIVDLAEINEGGEVISYDVSGQDVGSCKEAA